MTLDGQPLEDAVVCFHPIGTTRGTEAFGRTDANGHYALKSRHLGEGTPVGEYRVIIGKIVMPDGSPLPDSKDFDPMTTRGPRNPARAVQQSRDLGTPGESARRRRHDQLRSDDEAAAQGEITCALRRRVDFSPLGAAGGLKSALTRRARETEVRPTIAAHRA